MPAPPYRTVHARERWWAVCHLPYAQCPKSAATCGYECSGPSLKPAENAGRESTKFMCTLAEIVVRGVTCSQMKKVGRVYFKSQSECQHPLTERCTLEKDGGQSVVSHIHIVPNQLRLAGYDCSGPSSSPRRTPAVRAPHSCVLRLK